MENTDKHGVVTPELLERREGRAYKPFYPHDVFFNVQATEDTIRHFVDGMGDGNPLFRDCEYAKGTKYGKLIAPPCFLLSVRWGVPGAGLQGIHSWHAGEDWQWYSPLYEGDQYRAVCIILNLDEREGKKGGGRTWQEYRMIIYVNQAGAIVASMKSWGVLAERSRAKSAAKDRNIPKTQYSVEMMNKIHETYDKEEVRGGRVRYWEDVSVGESVGPIAKGPLSVRDLVAWLIGAGSPFFKAHKLEYEWEKKHPKGLMRVEETGESDVPELVHVLDAFAREIGVERAYDYGAQRIAYLSNLFTNWMGDQGFLWKMRGELRKFYMVGDTLFFSGKVVKKYVEGDKYCVDIEAWALNQREEYCMPPNMATIVLPSKAQGPATYPPVPDELIEYVKRAKPLDELLLNKG